MKLESVTLIEAMKKPGGKTGWGNLNTALFTSKGDVDGGFDIEYDVPSGLVTVSRGNQAFSVHITRTRDMIIARDQPVTVAQITQAVKPGKPIKQQV